jgi:hypothetical protein
MASRTHQQARNEAREAPSEKSAPRSGPLGRRGYLWATLVLLAGSLAGHWTFGWFAYVEDAREHGQAPELSTYSVQMARDTLENWQSEFLQLIWQVVGLAIFLYVGSTQSKEGHERLEAKLDFLLSQTSVGDKRRKELDREFMRQS